MALAKITILGFKSYMDSIGEDLFKNLSLPEGIDKDVLIENIYNECAEFEMLYSNPFYVQSFIGTWSNKHYRTFQKWIDALNIEYEPLYNYDRMESWTDKATNTDKVDGSYDNKTKATATTADSATTTNKISAFDSNTLQNDTQADSSGNVLNNSSGDNSGTNTSTTTGQSENIRTGRAYGNIGVTTSQQMLQSELDISRWNIINNITDCCSCFSASASRIWLSFLPSATRMLLAFSPSARRIASRR